MSDPQQTTGRYGAVPRVLIFLTRGDALLLLRGGPHKWFAGRYNGIGGHVEPDEDVLSAARRETGEEAGIEPPPLDLGAVIHVTSPEAPGVMLFAFTGALPAGTEPGPCDEGTLEWVAIDATPHLPLVEDLPWLLPRLLARAPGSPPLFAHYALGPDGLRIHPAD